MFGILTMDNYNLLKQLDRADEMVSNESLLEILTLRISTSYLPVERSFAAFA